MLVAAMHIVTSLVQELAALGTSKCREMWASFLVSFTGFRALYIQPIFWHPDKHLYKWIEVSAWNPLRGRMNAEFHIP